MKRIFTSFVVLCLLTFWLPGIQGATVTKLSVLNTYTYSSSETKPANPTTVLNKLYNQAGQLEMEISASSKAIYAYNSQGLVDVQTAYSWNSINQQWDQSSKNTYIYDNSGQLIRVNSYRPVVDTLISYIEYSNYENGIYKSMKTFNYDGSRVDYWNTYKLGFNNGQLVSSVRNRNADETTFTILDSTAYAYTNGKKSSATLYLYNKGSFIGNVAGTWQETYSYNTNGDIESQVLSSKSRYGAYMTAKDYIYASYDNAYAPTNFTAQKKTDAGKPNIVTLNWTPSSAPGVTGYRVICDTIVSDIIPAATHTYTTTKPAQNGMHEYAVVAVVGSDIKNISNRVSLELKDEGVKPASNLRITNLSTKNESDGSYDVTVAWDAPQTTSTITKYQVYYSPYSYFETTTSPAVINIPDYIAEGSNGDGDTYGLDVSIFVVAVYETGMAEQSNTVVCNPFDHTITSVNIPHTESVTMYQNTATKTLNFSEQVAATIYSINGIAVKTLTNGNMLSVADLSAGVYIVRMQTVAGETVNAKFVVR